MNIGSEENYLPNFENSKDGFRFIARDKKGLLKI